jgi:hypothetical protein
VLPTALCYYTQTPSVWCCSHFDEILTLFVSAGICRIGVRQRGLNILVSDLAALHLLSRVTAKNRRPVLPEQLGLPPGMSSEARAKMSVPLRRLSQSLDPIS